MRRHCAFQEERKSSGKAQLERLEQAQSELERDTIAAQQLALETELTALLAEQKSEQLAREEVRVFF